MKKVKKHWVFIAVLTAAMVLITTACPTGGSGPSGSGPTASGFYGPDGKKIDGITTLLAAVAYMNDTANDAGEYVYVAGADESVEGTTQDRIITRAGNSLTLKGTGAGQTITKSGNGFLLGVQSGVTLILDEKITLEGHSGNSNSLVQIGGGTLEMKTGSKITGNTTTYGGGVGVFSNGGGGVFIGGTFTMSGGEITGNTADDSGGGVYVQDSSVTFTMTGGSITGNTTSTTGGGGVHISFGCTFTMSGGDITDNTAKVNGGGVYVQTSAFTMSGGSITGNTASNGGGGGVYVQNSSAFTMSGGSITGNAANGGGGLGIGGGVLMDGGTFTMNTPATQASIKDNIATGPTPQVHVYSGTVDGTAGVPGTGW